LVAKSVADQAFALAVPRWGRGRERVAAGGAGRPLAAAEGLPASEGRSQKQLKEQEGA
jgi:hypothetical protein